MTFAEDEIVYRDFGPDGLWGSFRLIVGGRDVTMFRGVPAQIGGYQLEEPYGYGLGEFSFPQVTSLEVDAWGTGVLSWLDLGKSVRLVQVDSDGNRVRVVWRGFISSINPWTTQDDSGTNVHCDGEASGTLAMRDKHPELFTWVKDAGRLIYDNFRNARLPMKPHLGLDTGIELDERTLSGGTFLEYDNGILAQAMKANGDQLTVMPNDDGVYVQKWKDRSTVHATVFNGAAGVELDVVRDLQEEPTTIYASGRNPLGASWCNAKAPGLKQGATPSFPGSLSLGDSGDNVEILQGKLIGMGYLDREDAGPTFDDDTEDAVIDLQEDARLAKTGVVNSATWDALYDVGVTGPSLRHAFVAPVAQLTEVQRNLHTASGSVKGRNPDFEPQRREVDRTVSDMGRKRNGVRWAKRELERVQTRKNWAGTLTLATDVAVGDHTHGTTPSAVMSRLDLTAGMNVEVRNFDGATLFHVAGINVDSDLTVRLAVDTQARDLLDVGARIERNRAARSNPARQWIRDRRSSGINQRIVEFSGEIGGRIWETVDVVADGWTVFPVVAGQSGSIQKIRVKVTDSKCEFVVAAFAKKVGPAFLRDKIGNPFNTVGRLQSITLDSGGSGYTSAPTVTLSGGGGKGAKAVASVSGGVVTSVEFTSRGQGYESAPSVSFSGGGGSGASASVGIGATGSGRWTSDTVADLIDRQRILLNAWGDEQQPGGYYPGTKTGEDGTATGDPLTGVFMEDGGFDYWTLDEPVIYVAVYAKQACKIKPQRVLWPVYEAGM